MNTNIDNVLLNRTSVRRYQRKPIESEQLSFIYKAIANSPTSYNGQQFSVIAVDDQSLKEELYEIIGQKQIKTSAIFLLFCVDYNKIELAAKAKEVDYPPFYSTMDGVIVGVVDAALAMQNGVIAAQSLGLGSCCIGYARTAAPERIAELLKLPRGVFVVCGLAIGHPAEEPDIKPKQPLSLLVHRNHYRSDDMTAELLSYDADVSYYNKHRSGTTSDNDWVRHIADYYRLAMSYDMTGYLRRQGFKL